MLIKKCKICGKPFEVRHSTHTLCSPECRKKSASINYKSFYERNKIRVNGKNVKKYREKVVGFSCKFCGEEVKPFVINNRLRRRRWHEECLINKCIEAIKNGEPFNSNSKILGFANNKGYTKSEILEIMKERNEER